MNERVKQQAEIESLKEEVLKYEKHIAIRHLEEAQSFHETGTDDPIDFPVEVKEDLVLNLDQDDLYNLMLAAHEQDLTLNQLVENILRNRLDEIEQEALLDKGSLEQSSEV